MVLACFGAQLWQIYVMVKAFLGERLRQWDFMSREGVSGLRGLSSPASGSQMSLGSGDLHLFLSFFSLFSLETCLSSPFWGRSPAVFVISFVDQEVLVLDGDSLEAPS